MHRIQERLPAERQNLLFSATLPLKVEALALELLNAPVRVAIESAPEDAPAISQRAIRVDESFRTPLLRHLIETEKWPRVLVFVARQYTADHVSSKLRRAGVRALSFHGGLEQSERSRVLADFERSNLQVLVATDLAARGIDLAQLPAVVNYDLPRSAVDYTHRIGRTGRAGESGVAVSFLTANSAAHFGVIEKQTSNVLPREEIPGFEPEEPIHVPSGTGGIKGHRKSKKDKLREAAAREKRRT
jgi:superfamily II DNA/RNA helicase